MALNVSQLPPELQGDYIVRGPLASYVAVSLTSYVQTADGDFVLPHPELDKASLTLGPAMAWPVEFAGHAFSASETFSVPVVLVRDVGQGPHAGTVDYALARALDNAAPVLDADGNPVDPSAGLPVGQYTLYGRPMLVVEVAAEEVDVPVEA